MYITVIQVYISTLKGGIKACILYSHPVFINVPPGQV